MNQNLDLTTEFINWLPDENAAWHWLGKKVATSGNGGKLVFRPSKPESFRCERSGEILSLRAGSILAGRLPLRKWLLALLLIAQGKCLPKCRVLSAELGSVIGQAQRGTSTSGAFEILKTIKGATVSDATSWWQATCDPRGGVLPWLLIEWLAERFALKRVAIPEWKSWVRRKSPQREHEGGQYSALLPNKLADPGSFFRYFFEVGPYDIRVQQKLRAAGGRASRAPTWFTFAGLRLVPRELWPKSDPRKSELRSRIKLKSLLPNNLYMISDHHSADAVKRFHLRRPFDKNDLDQASQISDGLSKQYPYERKFALIDRLALAGKEIGFSAIEVCYVIRARVPGRPTYYFCSKGDPGQHAYDRLLKDLLLLEGNYLNVLTRCKRFRERFLPHGLDANLTLTETDHLEDRGAYGGMIPLWQIRPHQPPAASRAAFHK